jgi:hypothetical protein
MEKTRQDQFLAAVRTLARESDDEIEYEHYKGGAVRINGFRRIRGGLLAGVLEHYGKRARYTTTDHVLHIDCYDDTAPSILVPTEVKDCTNLNCTSLGTMVRGSVASHAYGVQVITSEDVYRIMSCPGTFDVLVEANKIMVLKVHVGSLGIVGGLHDRLTQKQMKPTPTRKLYHRVAFKPRRAARRSISTAGQRA